MWNMSLIASSEISNTTDASSSSAPQLLYALRGTLALMITLGIIVSNVINVYIWHGNKQLPPAMRHFLLNLSCCDLLVGLVATSSAVYPAFTGHWPFGSVWCQVSGVTHGMSVTLSIWTIAMIGVERYVAAVKPYKYKRIMSGQHSVYIIGGLWLAALLTYTTPLLTEPSFVYYHYSQREAMCGLYWKTATYCVITAVYIPMLSAAILIFTSYKIRQHLLLPAARSVRGVAAKGLEMRRPSPRQLRSRTNSRALLILRATSICFLISWGPYVTVTVLEQTITRLRVPHWLSFALTWTANSNSLANFFIYSLTNKHFMKEAKRLLRQLSSCTSSSSSRQHSRINNIINNNNNNTMLGDQHITLSHQPSCDVTSALHARVAEQPQAYDDAAATE